METIDGLTIWHLFTIHVEHLFAIEAWAGILGLLYTSHRIDRRYYR